MATIPDSVLDDLERDNAEGLASTAIVELLSNHGVRFSEATLRKWVQLGLLPRSVRVGRKGKHRGSKGLYPVRAVRQILRIKDMMGRDLTIDEIQRRYLFVRGDIEQLEHNLKKIFVVLDRVISERKATSVGVRAVANDLGRARTQARDLVERLERIESRLAHRSSEAGHAEGVVA